MTEHRVIIREKMKPIAEATEEEKTVGFETVMEELRVIKPKSLIVLYHTDEVQEWGNIIYGEFSVGILKELTKEFENAYGEIIKRSVIK